jgi:hypothetical protein
MSGPIPTAKMNARLARRRRGENVGVVARQGPAAVRPAGAMPRRESIAIPGEIRWAGRSGPLAGVVWLPDRGQPEPYCLPPAP